VFEVNQPRLAECEVRLPLEVIDHLLRGVLVLADDEVDVVAHHDARIAGVLVRFDRLPERARDGSDHFVSERQDREIQPGVRLVEERQQLAPRRLDPLAPEVQVPDLLQRVARDEP
jgi:hypothetical protein